MRLLWRVADGAQYHCQISVYPDDSSLNRVRHLLAPLYSFIQHIFGFTPPVGVSKPLHLTKYHSLSKPPAEKRHIHRCFFFQLDLIRSRARRQFSPFCASALESPSR